ncbi:hypothetical protein BT63DRAFT_425177 [Microthyrium microscopicum]|uniref:Uncharacterized protein n=1 Tax=Microthyrium microscopicum TaxID=703497 RepID=A0A6A6UF07_9PEZI|nr:hypothetical protein BT63DRAFT_425177 [Microthyrium microscopicum]
MPDPGHASYDKADSKYFHELLDGIWIGGTLLIDLYCAVGCIGRALWVLSVRKECLHH